MVRDQPWTGGLPPTSFSGGIGAQRTPYAALWPEQNPALWRAESASWASGNFLFQPQTQSLCLTGVSVPMGTKGSEPQACPGTSGLQGPWHISVQAKSQGHPIAKKGRGEEPTPSPLVWIQPLLRHSSTPTYPRVKSRKADRCHLWLQGLLSLGCPSRAPCSRRPSSEAPISLHSSHC